MFNERKDYADLQHVLDKLEPDEPVFILRGKDLHAPEAIISWARSVVNNPDATQAQFMIAAHAILQAQEMLDWQQENPGKVKLPDLPAVKEPTTNKK